MLCNIIIIYLHQKLKDQYGSEWQYRSLKEFSFTQGSDHVSIKCEGYNFQDLAEVVLLSNNEVCK